MRSWLHITDAVRAIEAAARCREYAVINIGHPDVAADRAAGRDDPRELGADPSLISRCTTCRRG